MRLKRTLAVAVSAALLGGCVSQATQQALAASQQACSADLARGWSMNSPSCQQFMFLRAEAEQEKQDSGELAAGILGAVLAAGAVAAVTAPGGGGGRAPHVHGPGPGGGGPRPPPPH